MSECIDHRQRGNKGGYGCVKVNGRVEKYHRAVYCQANNVPITTITGLVVRHTCDNPRCINPQHLVAGSQADNMHDMKSRKRSTYGERHAMHKLTAEQVHSIRTRYRAYCRVNGGAALAEEFGVSQSQVSLIIRGSRWEWVNE